MSPTGPNSSSLPAASQSSAACQSQPPESDVVRHVETCCWAHAAQSATCASWSSSKRSASALIGHLLGASRVEVLGWVDSGTEGDPAPGSLCHAHPADVEAAIAAIVERESPTIVVTLDASDGHRDHAVVRDATLAALKRTAWQPARTYLFCLPRSILATFTGVPGMGTPDEDITTFVDVTDLLELRWSAMRTHASQQVPYDALTPQVAHDFLATDRLLRVSPPWEGGELERSWLTDPIS